MPSPFGPEHVLVCLDQVEVACLCPYPTHSLQDVHPQLPGVEYGDGFYLRSSTVCKVMHANSCDEVLKNDTCRLCSLCNHTSKLLWS